MIVTVNRDLYRYEIHSLVKAFFPEEDVKVEVGSGSPAASFMVITFSPGQIRMEITGGPVLCEEARGESPFDIKCPGGKAAMKHLLYRILVMHTGRELPWGELIGIRPTKLAMGKLEEGASLEEAAVYMETEHKVSREKALLAAQIAQRERKILAPLSGRKGYSIYVGIPFCPTTCLYCSFTSYPFKKYEKLADAYLDCVEKEIDWTAERFKDRTCLSVYIGGGTPTTLSPQRLRRLITYMKERIDCTKVREFTVECGRPDTIDADRLRTLKELGVTRISINPQTMNDATLARIGRRHTTAQIEEAYRLARSLGFDDINMDIILGLPGEGEKEVRTTIEAIEALAPDSLTVHALAVKRASRLKLEAAGAVQFDLSPEEASAVMDLAAEGAARMGLVPYYLYRQKNMAGNLENVGFCRPGKEGLYNILIMEEIHPIIALGAGTVTKGVFPDGRIERVDNVKTVEEYMSRIDEMIGRKERLFGTDDGLSF